MAETLRNKFLYLDSSLKRGDGSDKLFLRAFTGQEAISQMFVFQLDLLSALDTNVYSSELIGKKITFGVQLPEATVHFRLFNGTVSRFATMGRDGDYIRYQAVVVPEPWFLSRQVKKAIYQNFTVPDLFKEVTGNALRGNARMSSASFLISQEFVRRTNYRKREYIVQYDESELNFLMRLLEEEGICFYFKQQLIARENSTDAVHTMVLADSADGHPNLQPSELSFNPSPRTGKAGVHETITSWVLEDSVRTSFYWNKDFDFKNPNTNLAESESSKIADIGRLAGIYEYPGPFLTHDQGEQMAKARIREEELHRYVVSGSSSCSTMCVGYVFTLKDHPRIDQNDRHLLTSISHSAFEPNPDSQGLAANHYANTFTCVPFPKDAQPFRPPRITQKPRVFGCETAIVTGPKGDDDIYTDEYGRIKVQFHWDSSETNEKTSCYIRVGTHWAGTGWGAIHIPRRDQEVIVAFLYGDPDQPIVVGSVYNGTHAVPWELPKNKTQSGIKTRSTPNGSASNYNEIRFEDKKGSELLRIHAELNKTESVEADSREYVGHDRLTKIGNDRKTQIKQHDNLHVTGDSRVKIEGQSSIHVQQSCVEKIDQSYSLDVGELLGLHAQNLTVVVDQMICIKGPGGFINIDPSGVTISGLMVRINSGGAPNSLMPQTPDDPEDPDEQHGGSKGS